MTRRSVGRCGAKTDRFSRLNAPALSDAAGQPIAQQHFATVCMGLPDLPGNFSRFGFSDPTLRFCRITTSEDQTGRAVVDGVVVIPGLPVCSVRMKTDVERIHRHGPGRHALLGYIRAALHEDVVVELPWN